jgi:hypothetical protein
MKFSFSHEPAAWIGAISAVLTLLVAFNIKLEPNQRDAIIAVAGAIFGLAFITRSQVVPNVKVITSVDGPGPAAKSQGGPGVTKILVAGLLGATLLAGAAQAQPTHTVIRNGVATTEPDSSVFGWWRLGGSVSAQAAALEGADGQRFTAFLPGAGLSYSWTDELSTSANVEGEPSSQLGWASVGARLRTYKSTGETPLSVYVGVDYVWANKKARERLGLISDRHTELSIRMAAPVVRRKPRPDEEQGSTAVFVIASTRWSPDERITVEGLERRRAPEYAIGLRAGVFGGR